MISKGLLSEVLDCKITKIIKIQDDILRYNNKLSSGIKVTHSSINIHELAFDKCIEWAWEQGYSITMFRANNIFHVRVYGNDVEGRRFYSNPDDKYDAVIQACEWMLKRKKDD